MSITTIMSGSFPIKTADVFSITTEYAKG
jgi:hypothetical protein